ncbi:MAG: signal peptidase I [Clostridia bacterium]|nr:signal peptidase I [Clostridia bacterium]
MEAEKKVTPAQQEVSKKKKKGKEKEKKTLKQEIMSWIWTILAAFAIAFFIRAFIAEPIRVDGTSMTNTLLDGEIVLVSKLDYRFGDMQRNDIIICRYPGRVNSSVNLGASLSLTNYTLFVKRLVALPGDAVEIKSGHLYVNDELVPDPEKMASIPKDFEKITLGEDQYFVVGDNRRTSHDSRADDVGPISASAIMGKVKCVILPFSNIRGVE